MVLKCATSAKREMSLSPILGRLEACGAGDPGAGSTVLGNKTVPISCPSQENTQLCLNMKITESK